MESQIEKLKQKYWEGKTSLDEEKQLKKSLENNTLDNFENRFFDELNKRKSITSDSKFKSPKTKIKLIWRISSFAATIAIIITLAIGLNNTDSSNQYAVNNPEEAYEISRQALMMVSSQLNRGKAYSLKLNKINTIKQTINK